jgi:hypothetical protein
MPEKYELTKEHGHELTPLGGLLSTGLSNQLMKLGSRDHFENLAEHATDAFMLGLRLCGRASFGTSPILCAANGPTS